MEVTKSLQQYTCSTQDTVVKEALCVYLLRSFKKSSRERRVPDSLVGHGSVQTPWWDTLLSRLPGGTRFCPDSSRMGSPLTLTRLTQHLFRPTEMVSVDAVRSRLRVERDLSGGRRVRDGLFWVWLQALVLLRKALP